MKLTLNLNEAEQKAQLVRSKPELLVTAQILNAPTTQTIMVCKMALRNQGIDEGLQVTTIAYRHSLKHRCDCKRMSRLPKCGSNRPFG